ncbi:MAG: AbrB/MazE/SpoVT family DNA-binding domain-containing protein [Nitrospinales bacterium]
MDSMIGAWGNSLGLRIPKAYARAVGLDNGTKVKIVVEKGQLVIKPLKRYSLRDLVDQISSDNAYGEMDFGKPEGKEVW